MSQDAKFLTLNRFMNPNAQFGVGGATVFVDPASTSPTTGAGTTTATVSLQRTVTNPLEGIASFLYTGSTNAIGQGWRFDIPIQPSDWTKVFTLKFDYQISSGSYLPLQPPSGATFSDLTMWIYSAGLTTQMDQVQNWQLDGSVSTTNQYSYQGSWQCPVGATLARVIWYQGNAVSGPFTARFNNISFGREPRQQGTIETEWTQYTMTITGSSSNPTKGVASTDKAYWRRVGDSVQIQYTYISTDATGAAAGSGRYRFSLPPGMVADSNKITAISGSNGGPNVGSANGNGTTPGSFNGQCVLETTTAIAIFVPTAADHVGSAYCPLNGSVTKYSFDATVPIQGWGANGTLGQDADTRVVSMRIGLGSTFAVPSATSTRIPYATTQWDTHGGWAGASYHYVAPVAGYYDISGGCEFTASLTSSSEYRIVVGTSHVFSGFLRQIAQAWQANANGTVYLASGQVVSTALFQSSGSTTIAGGNGAVYNYLCINRLSGPAQVQAAEVVTARYNTNAGQSITSGGSPQIIDFEDRVYDDHGCVTTGASWKFTAPRTGRVSVKASLMLSSAAGWIAGELARISIAKNGTIVSSVQNTQTASHSNNVAVQIADSVSMNAGDYIDIRLLQDNGSSIALVSDGVYNFVDIEFVGGITQ